MNKQLSFKMKLLYSEKKYKRHANRHTLFALIPIIILLVLFPIIDEWTTKDNIIYDYNGKKFVSSFVGNIKLNKYYYLSVDSGKSEQMGKYLKNYLENSDYIFGSVKGPINEIVTTLLRDFKFSNVAIDDKTEGVKENLVMNRLIPAGIEPESGNDILYQEINGMKVVTFGVTEGNFIGYLEWIIEAKEKADLIIVHINWEKRTYSYVDDVQRNLARALCDVGADIILGYNSCSIQPIEIYNDKLIFYSLGDFLPDDLYGSACESILVQYIIEEDGFSKMIRVIPLNMAYGYPKPALRFYEYFQRQNIFKLLTRDIPKDNDWKVQKGILEIELD